MSALSTTEQKKESEQIVSFMVVEKQEWVFKKVSDKEIIFSIGGEVHGKVTMIKYDENDQNLIVTCQKSFKTALDKADHDGVSNFSRLASLCPPEIIDKKSKTKPKPQRRLMTRMLAAVNGRCNFDFYSPLMTRERPESCQEITRELLIKMLKRENDLRLSKEILEAVEKESSEYEEIESCSTDKLTYAQPHALSTIVQCQEKVAQEFGYKTSDEISYAVQILRSARALYPNDIEIQNAAFYLKYNRAHRGELKVNDSYKDVPLMTCAQEETKLSAILNSEKPTVVISGSVT